MGKKNTPINDDELRRGVDAYLAKKKTSQQNLDTSSTSSTTGSGSFKQLTENPFGAQSQEDFIGKENAERIKSEVAAAPPIQPVKIDFSKVDMAKIPYAGMSLDEIERLSPDQVSVEESKRTKDNGEFLSDLGNAFKSGLNQMGAMVGLMPSASVDAALKNRGTLLPGFAVIGDWIKSNNKTGKERNPEDNLAMQYFDSMTGVLDALNPSNDIDAEDFGRIMENAAGIPEEYNPISPNNRVVKEFQAAAEKNREKAYKNYDGGIWQAIKDKKYNDAGKLTALGVMESLPIMLGLAASRGAGLNSGASLSMLGLGTTGQTYKELKETNPDFDKKLLYANAVLTGAGEAGSELLGSNFIYNQGRKLYMRGAKKEAEEVVKTGIKSYVDAAFRKAFVGASALDEGATEAVNQIWKNAVDKWTGVRPDVDYTDGAMDAFIVGNGAGAAFAAPFQIASKVNSLANKKSVRELNSENESIAPFLSDPNIAEETKSRLSNIVATNTEKINDVIDADAAQANRVLNTTEKKNVSTINQTIDEKESILADPTIPETIKEATRKSIEQLENNIEDVVSKASERKDSLEKLAGDAKLADTPEKIQKVVSKVSELTDAAEDPQFNEVVETASKNLKKAKSVKPKEGETLDKVKEDLMAELEAELDSLKQNVQVSDKQLSDDIASQDSFISKPSARTDVGDTVIWNGKPREIESKIKVGSEDKYKIKLDNGQHIWTNLGALQSDYEKGLNPNAVDEPIQVVDDYLEEDTEPKAAKLPKNLQKEIADNPNVSVVSMPKQENPKPVYPIENARKPVIENLSLESDNQSKKDLNSYDGIFDPKSIKTFNHNTKEKKEIQLDRNKKVIFISPDEYLKLVNYGLNNNIINQLKKSNADQQTIKKFEDNIENSVNENLNDNSRNNIKKIVDRGEKLDMPFIFFNSDGKMLDQDGRNRANYAKELGEASIPVAVENLPSQFKYLEKDLNEQQNQRETVELPEQPKAEETTKANKREVDYPTNPNKYYSYSNETNSFSEIKGAEPVNVGVEGDFFVHPAVIGEGYVVTEGSTGLKVSGKESFATPEEAVSGTAERIKEFINTKGEDAFYDMIKTNREKSESPRFTKSNNTSLKVGDNVDYNGVVYTVDNFEGKGVNFRGPDGNLSLAMTSDAVNKQMNDGKMSKTDRTPTDEPPKPRKKSLKDKISQTQNEELAAAKKAFLDTFKNLNSGINPETLDKGLKLMAVYTKLGVYKFADIVTDFAEDAGDKIADYFDAIKSAYGAFIANEATDEQVGQMDGLMKLRKYKLEDFITPNIENNGTSEPLSVDENAPAISTGESTASTDGAISGQNVEETSGRPDDDSSQNGNGSISVGETVATGDTAGSGTENTNAGGNVDGTGGSDGNTGRNVPKNTGQRKVSENDQNYSLNPSTFSVPTGDVSKFNSNIDAIFLLNKLEAENRNPTPAEKDVLSRYVGWGGLSKYLSSSSSYSDVQVVDAFMQGLSAMVYKSASSYAQTRVDFTDRGPVDLSKYNSATELLGDIRTTLAKEGYSISPESIRPTMIKNMMTPDEFRSAQVSTASAHYTPVAVIDKMWDIVSRLGFKGGNVLESSAGTGLIMGLMPQQYRNSTNVTAHELDSLTGRILSKLYPQSKVNVEGFEFTKVPLNSQDLAITNVPFGQNAPYDRFYPELSKFSLHNYFIAKNLKLLKPGGIGVIVTSSSTLDANASAKFREWVISPTGGNSVLVGAIRLPNNAFTENAGTQVTTDMLIFQKRGFNDNSDLAQTFRYTSFLKEGTDRNGDPVRIDVNEYYVANPEQMLGEMMTAHDAGTGALYGNGAAPTLMAPENFDLTAALNNAIDNIPANILDREGVTSLDPLIEEETLTDITHKEGSIFSRDGKIYRSENGVGSPVQLEGKQNAIANDYVGIKTDIINLIDLEINPTSNDGEIDQQRQELNKKYDAYVKKHGFINGRSTSLLDDLDIDFPIVSSVENVTRSIDKNNRIVQEVSKGDIFQKRVNFPRTEPTEAKDIADALDISLNYKNGINVNYIAKLLGQTPEDVARTLIDNDLAFENPDTGILETPSEYLSGYVREKLKKAEIALENDPKYAKNVEELSKVIPDDIPSSLIQYTLGSAWIPTTVYEEFMSNLLDADITVQYLPVSGKFSAKSRNMYGAKITSTYAAGGKNAMEILNATLNNIQIEITETIKDGMGKTRSVKNLEKTAAAQAMQEQLQEEFAQWVRDNEAIQVETERIYNDIFNGQVLRNYRVPEFKHYPGASHSFTLREHQKRAVSRGLANSTLFAHQVGTGKTLTFITTAMEMRRLGLARKPMIVVQNATRGQVISTFKALYPSAKILAPSDKDMNADGRKRFFAKMATGDWDAIIIPQSQLSMIPDDPARQQAYIMEQIDEMRQSLTLLNKRENNFEYRQLEKDIKSLEKEYEELENPIATPKRGGKTEAKRIADKSMSIEASMRQALDRKTDDIFNFEQLGVDALLIDEAHAYKRLGFQTSMKNIKGIDTSKSKRSQSVLLKVRWVQEKTGGKNVNFYTGTPISNTMAEAWTMLRYVAPEVLTKVGIEHFDQFAKTFGQVIPSLEQTGGGTFKVQNRFAKFQNLPEFITAFRSATDVVLSEDVKEFQENDTLPKLKDGKITQVVIPQSPELKQQIKQFRKTLEWFDKLNGKEKRENSHIPLVIFNKAKQSSIDLRLLDPTNVDSPDSKVNQAIKNALGIYKSGNTVQMIFSDMYQSPEPKNQFLDEDELIPNPAFNKERFNLFNDIKKKLMAGGVPENEIVILTDPKYDNVSRKEKLFDDANSGKVRFLLGTTERMGVGVNAQRKLKSLHHLDAPPRPMDFEQRNGRIVRQGNENKEVELFAYGVEKTLDASAFQRLSTKQKFINQIMKGENIDRVTEDPADEAQMTFDEMMAQLSDSPYAMQKLLVDNKLRSEKTKRENHNGKLVQINRRIQNTSSEISRSKAALVEEKKYAELVNQKFADGNITSVVASGVTSTEEFGKGIQVYIDMLMDKWNNSPTHYAKGAIQINGVQVEFEIKNRGTFAKNAGMVVNKPELSYTSPEIGIFHNGYGEGIIINSNSSNGFLASFRSSLAKAQSLPARTQEHISELETDLEQYKKDVNVKFDDTRLKELERESEALQEKMINEKRPDDDDPNDDGGGGGTDVEYILDQSNVKPVLDALDKLKINNNGRVYTSIVPIPPAVWNGAIEAMKAVVKATNSLQKGIRVAAKYIVNKGGSAAQAAEFTQIMNEKYGPDSQLATRLKSVSTRMAESKQTLTEIVQDLVTETDPKVIKQKLASAMSEAKRTQLVKQGVSNADNAADAIKATSEITDTESALEAIDKVLDFLKNVGYNSAIRYAMNVKSRLDNMAKRYKMLLTATSKELARLDPRSLNPLELDRYMEIAPVLLSQLEGKDAGLIPDNEIASFLNDVRERQETEVKEKLIKRYADLGLDQNMSMDEIRNIIDNNKQDTEQAEQSMEPEAFNSRENKKRDILNSVLSINRDELHAKRNIPAEKKFMTDALLSIDENMLSTGDLLRLNQVIANIVANDNYIGAGYFSKVNQGINQLKKYSELAKRLGGFRPITQDNWIKDRLKGSRLDALSLTDKYLHLNTFEEVGKATDEMLSMPIGNGYAQQKSELKSVIDGLEGVLKANGLRKDVNSMYRIGVFAELNAYNVGDKRTPEQQFLDNKGLLVQSLEALQQSKNKYEQQVYAMLSEIFDEIQGATNIGDLSEFLTEGQKAVYDYIRKTGDANFGRLYENNDMYGSKPMKEKANYVHRRYVKLRDAEVDIDLVDNDPIIMSANGVLGHAGTKEDVVVTKKLPKGKVIDYNVYKSFRVGLNQSLNDIYTLGDRIKANYILESPMFAETLKIGNDSGKRNLNIIKDSIKQMVNLQRGFSKVDMDMFGGAAKVMNFFRQTFYGSSVGTVTAALPQYISSAAFALSKLNRPSSYFQSVNLFWSDSEKAKALVQTAGAGTQNRDLQGDTQLDDIANGLDNGFIGGAIPKVTESLDWMNDKLFGSLKYGDRLTSLHTWVAGYIDNLVDQGVIKSPSEFTMQMLEEHTLNPNRMAATSGETLVSMSNNESDSSRRPNMFVNRSITQEWVNDFLFPVKKFAVSMNNKLWLGIRNISEWDGGQGEGGRLVVGALASIAVYAAIRDFIINAGFDAIAGAATGLLGLGYQDDQEEEEKERLNMTDEQYERYKSDRELYKFGTDMVGDALLGGQNVLVEKGIKNIVNAAWGSFGDEIQKEAKANKQYVPRNVFYVSNGFSSLGGVYGKSLGMFIDYGSDQPTPLSTLVDIYKEDSEADSKARRAVFSVALPMAIQFGLSSADVERINNRIKRRVERIDDKYKDMTLRDKPNKDYKKYNGSQSQDDLF